MRKYHNNFELLRKRSLGAIPFQNMSGRIILSFQTTHSDFPGTSPCSIEVAISNWPG